MKTRIAIPSLALILVSLAPLVGTPLSDPLPDIGVGPFDVRLESVASGLVFPTHAAAPPDGSDRLFVCQIDGIVHVIEDGVLLPTPFVDMSADYPATNGSAMSSLAFHPDFSVNRLLYVIMSESKDPTLADFGVLSGVAHQSVLYELRALDDAPASGSNLADPASVRELLRINEDSTIHNLDALAFGPDGYLYASKGDDESGGQDTTTIHGTVLRLDVDRAQGNPISANGEYAIPVDNPFVGLGGGVVEEIYAYGFRNPWRMSFDDETGALWVADVGQSFIEEINRVVAGANHGWDLKEGTFATLPGSAVTDDLSGLPPIPFVDPRGQYDHGQQDKSITGGVLYRGWTHAELAGQYVFADWISGRLFHMHPSTGQIQQLSVDPAGETINGQTSGNPVEGVISVTTDASGELILVVTQRNMTPTARLLRVLPKTWVTPGGAPAGAGGRSRKGPTAPGTPGVPKSPR
jgi:hypothetical protein